MNMEQAKSIHLSSILNRIGAKVSKQNSHDIWYFSPFRNEKTASFHIHEGRNVWYDWGEGKGGNTIDFVCHYLYYQGEDHTPADALRWLGNMHGSFTSFAAKEEQSASTVSLLLRGVAQLEHFSFMRYLDNRGIPASLARKYLKQVRVENVRTHKEFYALGFINENNGYELRNKVFKGSIAPKTISFIRGAKTLPEDIHVFEGFMDFLSALCHQKHNQFDGDVIVLNSLACIPKAIPYIKNYSYKTLHSWLDNDAAGNRGTLALMEFAKQEKLLFRPMNKLYRPHKDVNAWHMHRLGR